ncbi:MAG: bifunctional riboflavin kinase/FAD synthetase [Acidimicrobiia bacterium]
MDITHGSPIDGDRGSAVTIGAYDGVHRGHRALLRLLRELADARGLNAALVTFDKHPAQVVRPESAPKLLTSLPQKLELLDATGLLDVCRLLRFDEQRRHESAEDFVREVLVGELRARLVVVGADFHFGHRRAGNVALLERMGADLGFEVVGLGLVSPATDGSAASEWDASDHEAYSSTRIRGLLADGDVAGAARLLGRPHEVRGTVETGDRRGRDLGFPTANIAVPDEIAMPADGIYAGTLVSAGDERPAALSLGHRPTFHDDQRHSLLEAHVLDFDGDLYGRSVAVCFVERIRGEEKFDTVDDLVVRIRRDVAETRRILGEARESGSPDSPW